MDALKFLLKVDAISHLQHQLTALHMDTSIVTASSFSSRCALIALVYVLVQKHQLITEQHMATDTRKSQLRAKSSSSSLISPERDIQTHPLTAHERSLLIRRIILRQRNIQGLQHRLEKWSMQFNADRVYLPHLQRTETHLDGDSSFSSPWQCVDHVPGFEEVYIRQRMKEAEQLIQEIRANVDKMRTIVRDLELQYHFAKWMHSVIALTAADQDDGKMT
jgi:hypothetical protein